MSFNRVCNCICDDPDDGGGGGAMCEQGECPDVFGLDVIVPANKSHYTKLASTNCCGFDTSSWSHSLTMINYAHCGGDCIWHGKMETPHCISATDCAFPFNSMTPDVSCYDSPAAIYKGCDHPTTAQANGTTQCHEPTAGGGHGDLGVCQCNVANGACATNGIGTIYRNADYTLHTHTFPKEGYTVCYRCGCSVACTNNSPNSACFGHSDDDALCGHPYSTCTCCPVNGHPGCSPYTTNGQVLYAGGLNTRLYSSLRYGSDFYPGDWGTRFYLTLYVQGLVFYAGQWTDCLGEWQQMVSSHSSCENYCCTENPSDSCPSFQGMSQACGFSGSCGGSIGDIDIGDVTKNRTFQIWGLPPDITPANCLDLRGVTQSTAGVVMVQDYDRVNLGDCPSEALDGDTVGRFGYFGYAKEFSPSWTVT